MDLDAKEVFGGVKGLEAHHHLHLAQQTLSPEELQIYLRLVGKIGQRARSDKDKQIVRRKQKPTAKERESLALAQIQADHQLEFASRVADLQENAAANLKEAQAKGIIAHYYQDVEFSKIPDETAARAFIWTSAKIYNFSVAVSQRNAAMLGRSLLHILDWWTHSNRPMGSFPKWVAMNCGSMGLTERSIARHVNYALVEKQFPKIVFVTLLPWTDVADFKGKFIDYVNKSEARRTFWSEANWKIPIQVVGDVPMQRMQVACKDPVDLDRFTLPPAYQQVLDEGQKRLQALFDQNKQEESDMQIEEGGN